MGRDSAVSVAKNCKGVSALKKSVRILLMLMVICLLAGCFAKPPEQTDTPPTSPPGQTKENEKMPTHPAGDPAPDNPENDGLTPYTFLNLICGNAETLSFTCSLEGTGADTITFQSNENAAVETYTASDMNGNSVSVRELEIDGKVHYIMDDSKIIKTYLAPAEDYLLYRMMTAANTAPDLTTEEDGYFIYEHSLPFEHDESISYKYRFYMKGGALKKLTIILGDEESSTYQFSEFQTELLNPAAFEYPEEYSEETFDYSYTGEHMPPWWEV